jgi:Transposase, Mutator family
VVTTRMELLELLSKAEGTDVDFLRAGVRVLAQALVDVEVAAQIGADSGQRAPDRRLAQRNGSRPREWDTRAGTVELAIPSCARAATSSPSWSRAGGPSGRWPAWSPSARWRACPPAGSTASPVHGPGRHLQVAGLAGLRRARRAGRRLAQPAAGRRPVPGCVAGRPERQPGRSHASGSPWRVGSWSQVRPSSSLPPALGVRPPTALLSAPTRGRIRLAERACR